jgi:CheY-like chemotaxis protein
VIEDDDALRKSLVMLLDAWGYATVTARNGEEALAILRRGNADPCLILLDLTMPRMSGNAFRLEQLKDERLRTIPTVVLSAADAAKELKDIAAFLPKPVEVDRLIDLVERYCATGTHC